MIKKILSVVLTLGMLLTIVSSLPVAAERPTSPIPTFEEIGEFKYDFEKDVTALSTENAKIGISKKNRNGGADDTTNYAEIRDNNTTEDDETPSVISFATPKNFTQKNYNTVTKVSFYIRARNDYAAGKIASLVLNTEDAVVFTGDVTSTNKNPDVASFTSKPLVLDEWTHYEVYFTRNYAEDVSFKPVEFEISIAKDAGRRNQFDIDEIEVTEYYLSQNFDFEKDSTDALYGWSAVNATVEKEISGYEGSAAKITAKSSNAGISHSVCYENNYKHTFEFWAKGAEGKKIFLSDGTNKYECGTLSGEWEKFSCKYRANREGEYSYFDLSLIVEDATPGDVFYVDSIEITEIVHNYELADVDSLEISGAVTEGGTLKFKTEVDVDSDIEVISTVVEIYLNEEKADCLADTVTYEGKCVDFEVVLPTNCAGNNILAKVIYLTAKGAGATATENLGEATLPVDASSSISKNEKDATATVSLENIRTAGSKKINGIAVLVLYDENNIIIGSKTEGFDLVAGEDAKSVEITANVRNYCSENIHHAEVLILDCGDAETPTLANTTMKEFATLTE